MKSDQRPGGQGNHGSSRFEDYWLATLKPGTPPDLVEHWRRYVLSGIQRGAVVAGKLSSHISLSTATALDLGCGYGGTSISLAKAGAQVTGVDIDEVYLRGATIWASEQAPTSHISFERSPAERLPFADSSFDLVVCADLMEHVDHQGLVVQEIGRVLREGGLAYVSFPNLLSPHNLRSDPHYQMVGVSLLPRWLGTWYVTRLRRRSPTYSVGRFPIASALRRSFLHQGMVVVWQNPVLRSTFGPLTALAAVVRDCTYPKVEWIMQKHLETVPQARMECRTKS